MHGCARPPILGILRAQRSLFDIYGPYMSSGCLQGESAGLSHLCSHQRRLHHRHPPPCPRLDHPLDGQPQQRPRRLCGAICRRRSKHVDKRWRDDLQYFHLGPGRLTRLSLALRHLCSSLLPYSGVLHYIVITLTAGTPAQERIYGFEQRRDHAKYNSVYSTLGEEIALRKSGIYSDRDRPSIERLRHVGQHDRKPSDSSALRNEIRMEDAEERSRRGSLRSCDLSWQHAVLLS